MWQRGAFMRLRDGAAAAEDAPPSIAAWSIDDVAATDEPAVAWRCAASAQPSSDGYARGK